jgi:hypothetical protein
MLRDPAPWIDAFRFEFARALARLVLTVLRAVSR